MQTVDHICHARWLITCNPSNQILENHSLVIHDGKILAICPTQTVAEQYQSSSNETYDTHAVLPGFINCHTHSAMTLFRGLADDLDLMDWLNNHVWLAEKQWVSDDMVYDGSLLAMAEMIRCGTTCFNDMYYFLDKTALAADRAGLRAFIGMTIIAIPTAWAKNSAEYFAKGLEFYQQYKNHDRIHATLAPHSTYMVSMDDLQKIKQLSDQYQFKINIHLQEDPQEIIQVMQKTQKRPLTILNELDLLSPNLMAVHMTQLNDDDLEILAQTKPNIVHCPESNMKLAGGICPVAKLQNMGINVALGTDGAASNNDLDMIGEMRSAAFLGKLGAQDPKALSAQTVLRMATINGAKALGIDQITGSLEIGKSADFIAIDFACIETQPLYNPISQLVYATTRQQVKDVWVAGKRLLKNRQLQTLDEQELLHKAQEWRERIKKNEARAH